MKILLKLLSLLVLIVPISAFAQYQTLVGIPGVESGGGSFDAYLQAVYATSISLAALLAVIKIVIAGVKWMTSDIVSTKSDAKKDIEGAILGLVVILAAVLILYIINPNIGAVSLNFEPAPRPAPQAPLNDSAQAMQVCTERAAAGCTAHTCDTSTTPPCADIITNCQALPGFVSIEEFGENNIACLSSSATVSEIDTTGSGVFDESAIKNVTADTTETGRSTYNRVLAEIEAAGGQVLRSYSPSRYANGAVSQRRTEQSCSDSGGTGVTYLTTPTGSPYRMLCTK
jgi:hypothetical protein